MAAGDESAFASLYEIYQPKLHLFVYPLTGFSLPDTHEVVQDQTLAAQGNACEYRFAAGIPFYHGAHPPV